MLTTTEIRETINMHIEGIAKCGQSNKIQHSNRVKAINTYIDKLVEKASTKVQDKG